MGNIHLWCTNCNVCSIVLVITKLSLLPFSTFPISVFSVHPLAWPQSQFWFRAFGGSSYNTHLWYRSSPVHSPMHSVLALLVLLAPVPSTFIKSSQLETPLKPQPHLAPRGPRVCQVMFGDCEKGKWCTPLAFHHWQWYTLIMPSKWMWRHNIMVGLHIFPSDGLVGGPTWQSTCSLQVAEGASCFVTEQRTSEALVYWPGYKLQY